MNDLRVYIRPTFAGPDKGEGGIRRWVEAQHKHLPDYGIIPVDQIGQADIVACHAADIVHTTLPLVVHNHGLYNTEAQAWSKWEWMMNRSVIEGLRRADIATVPSTWVANQIARGMCMVPRVLYAGVDANLWEPGENRNYVLWNKTRVDSVCDPTPLDQLAGLNPSLQFVSTFGRRQRHNIRITGRLPWEEAREYIRHAGIYLCTSKETFGIGTLEAMACGVPVLGWAWGGQMDIVEHGAMGYLAKPGDYNDLQFGLQQCFQHRDEWGAAARDHVLANFQWQNGIEHCASIYREAYELREQSPLVSVIVTVYDLEQYLPDCLDSVLSQTFKDWECIIIDDCSPGPCKEIADDYVKRDGRFRYIKTPKNLYLAGARNHGIKQSFGKYFIPLDCDDMLGERSLAVLTEFLEKNPGHDIAYGAFQLIEPDGRAWVSDWPPKDFRWEAQMGHKNQITYCALIRKRVWANTGGYRERCPTAEDADFWCRATSFGARPYQVSRYPVLIYRNREDSMSHVKPDVDWTAWYPWARRRSTTPFGAVGQPPNDMSWPVRTHDQPRVSVVIPVGPGHEDLVRDALDSVLAQVYDNWEVIVVNDSDKEANTWGHPWASVLQTPKPGSGPALARNIGIEAARGELIALLDADDYYLPHYLQQCVQAFDNHGGVVYTDWFQANEDGDHEHKTAPDYDVMDLLFNGLKFTSNSLFSKSVWEAVGGFDINAGGWEDWDFFFALATREVCGTHVPEPLFVYRYWSGLRREEGYEFSDKNVEILRTKWADYARDQGRKLMGCRSCRGGGAARYEGRSAPSPVRQAITNARANERQAMDSGMVMLEFVGESSGTRTYKGQRSGTKYRAGNNRGHKRIYVYGVDAPSLVALPDFDYVIDGRPAAQTVPVEASPLPMRQALSRVETGGNGTQASQAIEETISEAEAKLAIKPGTVHCWQCDHDWTPQSAMPKRCPSCGSRRWHVIPETMGV